MPPDVKRTMNPKPIQQAKSASLRGTWPALLRARRLAAQTGTAIVVTRNGVMQHIYPSLSEVEDSAPQPSRNPPCPH